MLPVQVCCGLEDLHLFLTSLIRLDLTLYYSSEIIFDVELVHT